jgi:hypothetical protein
MKLNYDMEQKLVFGFKASILTPLIWFIETYVFNDWDFLITIVLLVLFDGVVMIILSLVSREFMVLDGLKNFALKSFAVTTTVLCLSIIDLAVIKGEASAVLDFINSGFYSILLGFMGASILKNIYRIYPWEPIEILLDKLELKHKNKMQDGGI